MGCRGIGVPKTWAPKLYCGGSRALGDARTPAHLRAVSGHHARFRARLGHASSSQAVSGHRRILGQVLDISRVLGRDSFILSLENGEMSPDSVGSVRMSPENKMGTRMPPKNERKRNGHAVTSKSGEDGRCAGFNPSVPPTTAPVPHPGYPRGAAILLA